MTDASLPAAVVSAGRDGRVKVWSLTGENECVGSLEHGAPSVGVLLAPTGLIASVGHGGRGPRVWRMKSMGVLTDVPGTQSPTSVTHSPGVGEGRRGRSPV